VADLETSYLAVRGALVDAIKTAWSPVKIYFDPFDLPEDYAGGYPVVFIDARITAWENETPKTDEVVPFRREQAVRMRVFLPMQSFD